MIKQMVAMLRMAFHIQIQRTTLCMGRFGVIFVMPVFAGLLSPAFAATYAINVPSTAVNANILSASRASPTKIVTTIQQTWLFNLLKEALRRFGKVYEVEQMSTQMKPKRNAEEALAGTVDVFWSMTSKVLEETMFPVRIPLFKGLLGNRLLIIRKTDEAKFAKSFGAVSHTNHHQVPAQLKETEAEVTVISQLSASANDIVINTIRTQQATGEIQKVQSRVAETDSVMQASQTLSNQGVNRSEEIKLVLSKVTDLVSNISNMNIEVSHAAQEQTCVTEAISRTLNDLANVSGSASLDSEHLAQSSERLFHQGERLRALVTSFRL